MKNALLIFLVLVCLLSAGCAKSIPSLQSTAEHQSVAFSPEVNAQLEKQHKEAEEEYQQWIERTDYTQDEQDSFLSSVCKKLDDAQKNATDILAGMTDEELEFINNTQKVKVLTDNGTAKQLTAEEIKDLLLNFKSIQEYNAQKINS